MNVTVEKIFPTSANAKIFSKMNKRFGSEYIGRAKSQGKTNKELLKLAMTDLKDEITLWIKLDGKKIGMVISPWITDSVSGEVEGRFLDTRWIKPKYRGRGIGTEVMKILIDQYDIAGTNLIGSTLFNESVMKSLIDNGFGYVVPKWCIDSHYAPEEAMYNEGMINEIHWWVYRTDGLYKDLISSGDYQMVAVSKLLQQKMEFEAA